MLVRDLLSISETLATAVAPFFLFLLFVFVFVYPCANYSFVCLTEGAPSEINSILQVLVTTDDNNEGKEKYFSGPLGSCYLGECSFG